MHTETLTLDRISDAITVGIESFREDELAVWLRPNQALYPENERARFSGWIKTQILQQGIIVRIVVSDDSDPWWDDQIGEEVIGISIWHRDVPQGSSEKMDDQVWPADNIVKRFARGLLSVEKYYRDYAWPDRAAVKENSALMGENGYQYDRIVEDQNVGPKGHIWLSYLGTLQRYERKGVATRLLRWGIQQAEKEGVPIGLVASPKGLALYERLGFRLVGAVKFGPFDDPGLIRWPGGGERTDGILGTEDAKTAASASSPETST